LLLTAFRGVSVGGENLDGTQRFLLLSTLRASTLERELKQAAAMGYRILFASNESSGSDVGAGFAQALTERNQLVLEKPPQEPQTSTMYS